MAGQRGDGRTDDQRRAHHASEGQVLRRQREMWLMARDQPRRRRLQLTGVEVGTAEGSTSESN